MVHEAIRKQVGDDYIVGIRFVVDEDIEEGIGFEECVRLAQLFEREGHIDFFNAIFGRMDTDLVLAEHNMPGMSQPLAPFLAKVGAFKREVGLPVFHAARIPDIATARHAIAENLLDMVAMTRAHMADPQIVNKLMRGEEERIRPCVGASHCMYKSLPASITRRRGASDPAADRAAVAAARPQGGGRGRRAWWAGGGAGCRRARPQGRAVRGGQPIGWPAPAGGPRDLAARPRAIVDWRTAELARLGVEVRLNTYATADDVQREKPDAVIVATGGVPDTAWLDGAEHCTTVWDILSGTASAKDEVIVYDGTGRHQAVSCALHLAEQGRAVQFVTLDDNMGLEMEYNARVVYRKRFAEHGVRTTIDHQLERVRPSGNGLVATFRHELTGATLELVRRRS